MGHFSFIFFSQKLENISNSSLAVQKPFHTKKKKKHVLTLPLPEVFFELVN